MVETNVSSAYSEIHLQSVDVCKNVKTKYFLTIINVLYSFKMFKLLVIFFIINTFFLKIQGF